MQDLLHKVYVFETVTAILMILEDHGFKAQRRPHSGLGYAIGDHRIYSSVELKNGHPSLQEGVPSDSLAYIELSSGSVHFEELKHLVDKHLTPVSA